MCCLMIIQEEFKFIINFVITSYSIHYTKLYDYLLEDHQKRIVQAKIMEQNRISKELHDGIMNMLYGIRLNLEFFNESNEDSAVEERKKYIKKILSIENEIRKVSHDLRTDENYPNTDFTELLTVLVDSQNKVNPTDRITSYNVCYTKLLRFHHDPKGRKMLIHVDVDPY